MVTVSGGSKGKFVMMLSDVLKGGDDDGGDGEGRW